MRKTVEIGAMTLLLILGFAPRAAAEPSARAAVEEANQKIQQLVSQDHPAGSSKAADAEKQLKVVVNQLLDLDYMAEKALGRTWRERTAEERQEYLGLMRQLVERSYLRQARTRVDYTVEFGDVEEDAARGTAEVATTLWVKTRGRREEVEIVYTLSKRGGVWKVVDIMTDGSSTVRGYRAQFSRIIKQSGFDELVSRMRSRLEAGEADL